MPWINHRHFTQTTDFSISRRWDDVKVTFFYDKFSGFRVNVKMWSCLIALSKSLNSVGQITNA